MRLELRGLSAGYGDATVLRDVDLVVPDGTVVALLGPNGAGKTTLLGAVSGLLRARTGSVHLGGEDVTAWPVEARARLGLCHVTDGRALFPTLTVRENLRMFGAPQDGADAVERAVAAFPRLGDRLDQVAGTMSGGEQQMLALARAHVREPRLLLVDEASMGLAPIIVDEIFAFLERTAGTCSVLLVEQYATRALAIADFAYVLVRGRIVHRGEAADVQGSDLLAQYLGVEAGV